VLRNGWAPDPRTKRLRFFNVDNSNLRRARKFRRGLPSYYTKGSRLVSVGRAFVLLWIRHRMGGDFSYLLRATCGTWCDWRSGTTNSLPLTRKTMNRLSPGARCLRDGMKDINAPRSSISRSARTVAAIHDEYLQGGAERGCRERITVMKSAFGAAVSG
jgi:hypothetical protein